MVWVDRKGTAQPLPAPLRPYANPRLSPDDRLAAVTIGNDIWVYDLSRDTLTRLTFEGRNVASHWTPDGKRVWYSSNRQGANSLFWKLADGSGQEELLITSTNPRPGSMTPDGRTLLFQDTGPKTGNDLWVLPLEGDRKPHVFCKRRLAKPRRGFRRTADGWPIFPMNREGMKFTSAPSLVPAANGRFPPKGVKGSPGRPKVTNFSIVPVLRMRR